MQRYSKLSEQVIWDKEENKFIPLTSTGPDIRRYKEWLKRGNKPDVEK